MRWLGFVLVVIAVGCAKVDHADNGDAGGTNDTGEVGTGRTIEQACEEQVAARCREFEKCAPWVERWQFASEADCRTLGRQRCIDRARLPGVINPIGWIDRCTSALELRACGDSKPVDGCSTTSRDYVGTLPDGAQCVDDHQCAGGFCGGSALPHLPVCGACKRLPLVGDPCAADNDCNGGGRLSLICDASKRCEERPPELGRACSEAAFCSPFFACVDGTCQQGSLPEGSACDLKTGCAPGLMCSPDSWTCVVPSDPLVVGPGEACTGENPPAGGGPYRYCRGENKCVGGVCVPVTVEGCSSSSMLTCGWSAACRSETKTCEPLAVFCE